MASILPMWTRNPLHRSHMHGRPGCAIDRRCPEILVSSLTTKTYLPLAEHTSPGRHLGSYDMVIAPALSVHVILAFAALAFVGAVLFGAF